MTVFQNSADLQGLLFPPSNSVSRADYSYFNMIQKEVEWRGQSQSQNKKESEKIIIESAIFPSSNSQSQVDREYFDIVKGQNIATKEANTHHSKPSEVKGATMPNFLHHKIYSDSSRPVLGLYLGR